jgi:2',3'-cyclic-nucleotide 2'-phosphodiesterase (5'-nucleotidase family)
VVDSGNLLFRNPKVMDHLEAAATLGADLIVKAFNKIGCNAVNIGHYDLAMGKGFLLDKQKTVGFPLISANLMDRSTGKLVFPPYVIKEVEKIRIGIFGLMSDKVKLDRSAPDLQVDNPIETAKKMVAELECKCDVIILLSQLGHQYNMRLAEQVPNIDFILGGSPPARLRHKHTKQEKVSSIPIIHSINRGRELGRLDVSVVDDSYQFVSYLEKQEILTQVDEIKDRIEGFSQKLGTSSGDVKRTRKALKNIDKAGQQLADIQGSSSFTVIQAPMNDKIKDDLEIKKMVKQYKNGLSAIMEEKRGLRSRKGD